MIRYTPSALVAGMTDEEIYTWFDDSVALKGSNAVLQFWADRGENLLPSDICQRFIDARYNLLEDVRRGALAYYDFTEKAEELAIDLVYEMMDAR